MATQDPQPATPPRYRKIEDGELVAFLGEMGDCSDPSGHVYLQEDGRLACIYCEQELR